VPSEARYIVFSRVELTAAIRQYFAKTGRGLPIGQCRKLHLSIEASIVAHLEIVEDRNDRIHEIPVDSDQVMSALILYCKDEGIPLPLHATKVLQMAGSNICLYILKNLPAAVAPAGGALQVA